MILDEGYFSHPGGLWSKNPRRAPPIGPPVWGIVRLSLVHRKYEERGQ